MTPRHVDLLRALAPGRTLWLSAGGASMWPLLLPGDVLQVSRAIPEGLRPGQLGVAWSTPANTLIVHLVTSTSPFAMAAFNGRPDVGPLEPLGRVVAVRRLGVELPVPASTALLLRHLPALGRAVRQVPRATQAFRSLRRRFARPSKSGVAPASRE